VVAYRFLIEPGHPSEFYDAAALKIAPWCSHIAGTALFFAAGFLFSKRRPERNGLLFAAAFTALYAIIDAATVGFAGVFALEFVLSMFAKLLAALAGAYLATQKNADPLLNIQRWVSLLACPAVPIIKPSAAPPAHCSSQTFPKIPRLPSKIPARFSPPIAIT
jgi:hypothetical protein